MRSPGLAYLLGAAVLCSVGMAAHAQDQGGAPAGDHGGWQNGGPRPDGNRGGGPPPFGRAHGGPPSSMRGGLQLGPPGRWWDDDSFANDLQLRPEQRKRMDAIFEANRTNIVNAFHTLRQEDARMEEISRAPVLKEADLFAQIDRVTAARAAVEKATTHMLFLVRQEMTADQIARLEQHR